LSNTSAVVTPPSLRSHYARDRQREFGVLPRFNRQLFATSRRDLVDPRPPIIRRHAPDTVDPAVKLQTLERWVQRALLDQELILGRLLNELDDSVSMKIAHRQRPKDQHVPRTR